MHSGSTQQHDFLILSLLFLIHNFFEQILLNTELIFFDLTYPHDLVSDQQESTQSLLLQKVGIVVGFLPCVHHLIFICTKFYHLIDQVHQQFKVFLEISPHFITPNNPVPLANLVFSLHISFADHVQTRGASRAQALISLGVCWFSLLSRDLYLLLQQ